MAPKKGAAKAAKAADKAQAEKKKKNAEDKTFGLKNKNKSKVVQNFVKHVTQNVSSVEYNKEAEAAKKKAKKEAEEQKKRELDELFAAAIVQPKVPPGVDPKSIMCEFYRKGRCTKGFKCKFSHDEAVERKGAKMDIYSDVRHDAEDEGMEDWDQDTLEKAIKQKHAMEKPNQTKIICKHFIDAIEKKQYGWFWVCPNGGKECQYRHALPPGYVLKSQMKQLMEEEMANKKSVEEEIEEERQKVEARTPLTESVFQEWREKKMAERRAREDKEKEERIKAQRYTGREIFALEGFQAIDDTSASDAYEREINTEEEDAIKEMERLAREAVEKARSEAPVAADALDDGPTVRAADPLKAAAAAAKPSSEPPAKALDNLKLSKEDEEALFDDDDDDDLDEAALNAMEDKLSGAA